MPRVKDHPFFCFKKQCRKTAWDTPEYLTVEDWAFLREILPYIEKGDPDDVYRTLFRTARYSQTEGFFYRVLGWPEGLNYCHNIGYLTKCGLPMIRKNNLPKLLQALAEHDK